jgi:hypothetical protein
MVPVGFRSVDAGVRENTRAYSSLLACQRYVALPTCHRANAEAKISDVGGQMLRLTPASRSSFRWRRRRDLSMQTHTPSAHRQRASEKNSHLRDGRQLLLSRGRICGTRGNPRRPCPSSQCLDRRSESEPLLTRSRCWFRFDRKSEREREYRALEDRFLCSHAKGAKGALLSIICKEPSRSH